MRVVVIGEGSNLARAISDGIRDRWPDTEWANCYWQQELVARGGYSSIRYRKLHAQAELEEFDAAEAGAVTCIVDAEPDLIVNAAGMVTSARCYGQELEALRANYETARTVRRAAEVLGCKVLHLSTTGAYTDRERAISETTPAPFYQTAYSLTKLMGEQEINNLPASQQLVLRFAMIYGGGYDRASLIYRLVDRAWRRAEGLPVASHEQNLDPSAVKSPLFISDFVEAVVTLLDRAETGTWVIGSRENLGPFTHVLDSLAELGITTEGITWNPEEDSLGNHVPDISKLMTVMPAEWPRVALHEGILYVMDTVREGYESGRLQA